VTFELELRIGESELRSGDLASAEARLHLASTYATTLAERAALTRLRLALYQRLDQVKRAVEVGVAYLQQVGITWSPRPGRTDVAEELKRTWHLLQGRTVEQLIELPWMAQSDSIATLDVMSDLMSAARLHSPHLLDLIVLRMVNIGLEHGHCAASCVAYAGFATILVVRLGDRQRAWHFGRLGVELLQKHDVGRSTACRYWIQQLQAHFFAGDYAAAAEAEASAKSWLWTLSGPIDEAEYRFFSALVMAALCALASAQELAAHITELRTHRDRFTAWAISGRENFADRAALISAELARVEGRELDAQSAYEQAIQIAIEGERISHQALGHELAARFYADSGLASIADFHFANARQCFARWGADGKAQQLALSRLQTPQSSHGARAPGLPPEYVRDTDPIHHARADLNRVAWQMTLAELASCIAHEVNQPLTAVVANAESCQLWLTKTSPNVVKARLAAQRIARDGHHAAEVIRKIRGLIGRSPPALVPLAVHAVLVDTLELMRSELQQNQVSLELDLSPNLPTILGDRAQLQHVVASLVTNGIEALHDVRQHARLLRVSSLQSETDVVVEVADSGMGLAEEAASRVFDPWFTTKPARIGMGLATCRSIVEAHRGRIWVTPHRPHGCVFRFSLPTSTQWTT
jgi:C4-dicarboxylate-specific signal transduction histidine kinase